MTWAWSRIAGSIQTAGRPKAGSLVGVPGSGPADAAGIDREEHAREGLAGTDLDALQRDAVGVRLEFEVVANVHRCRKETDFLRELLAQAADALEQFAVLAAIDQRDQPVADLETEHIDRGDVGPAGFGSFFGRRRPARLS